MTKMHDPRPASCSSQSRPAPTVHRAFSPCISPLAPGNRALSQWEAWIEADKEMGDGEDGGGAQARKAGERVNAGLESSWVLLLLLRPRPFAVCARLERGC